MSVNFKNLHTYAMKNINKEIMKKKNMSFLHQLFKISPSRDLNVFFYKSYSQQSGRVVMPMEGNSTLSAETKIILERMRKIVPPFTEGRHKGQAGRVGVIGGSIEYTGAPYFAAISALRTGADLVHVFCQQQAASVIKSYSPELIVHPLLDSENALDQIEPWLERLHVLVIGPGLGRDRNVLQTVEELIRFCRKTQKPLIIDADGLFLVTQNPELIKNYDRAILTPNAMEFTRLFGSQRELIPDRIKILGNGVTVLEKGRNDRIHNSRTTEKFECSQGGSGRRCGGQGDLLSGALATMYYWALESKDPNPAFVACFSASFMTKKCNELAFAKKGRSTIASDMIEEIHYAFEEFFEPKSYE